MFYALCSVECTEGSANNLHYIKKFKQKRLLVLKKKKYVVKKEDKFICTNEISDNNVYIEDDKVVLKPAQCTEEEGKEYEVKLNWKWIWRLLGGLEKCIRIGKEIEQ